jgi:glycosyltransferase involved in cell wall biosynthesis
VILGARADPEYAVASQALAMELGVAHEVDMPGFVHNPFAFMSRAAVFVLSSRYEGLGNVLIEAARVAPRGPAPPARAALLRFSTTDRMALLCMVRPLQWGENRSDSMV